MFDKPAPKVQMAGQKGTIRREHHVWRELSDGRFRCVLCGGVAREPSVNEMADGYEKLTDEDRALSPPTPLPAA